MPERPDSLADDVGEEAESSTLVLPVKFLKEMFAGDSGQVYRIEV